MSELLDVVSNLESVRALLEAELRASSHRLTALEHEAKEREEELERRVEEGEREVREARRQVEEVRFGEHCQGMKPNQLVSLMKKRVTSILTESSLKDAKLT